MTTPPVSEEPKLETSAGERKELLAWTGWSLASPEFLEITRRACGDIDYLLAENRRLRSGSLAQEGWKVVPVDHVRMLATEMRTAVQRICGDVACSYHAAAINAIVERKFTPALDRLLDLLSAAPTPPTDGNRKTI